MPRRKRVKSKSGYYHVMIRGNEKKNIFNNNEDKFRFMEILNETKKKKEYCLHAFCLMSNHVHLMLSEGIDDVAKVMKRINVRYAYYFNKKYKRVGHLFQDRYRSEVVENDSYILSLARYIHQNPVKAGIVKAIGDYKWSSYNAYLNNNDYFAKMLDRDIILGYFSENRKLAMQQYAKYMSGEDNESFIDLTENDEIIDEETSKEIFRNMLSRHEIKYDKNAKIKLPDEFIKEFKQKTNLSIRKIAAITGINKDTVNKALKR